MHLLCIRGCSASPRSRDNYTIITRNETCDEEIGRPSLYGILYGIQLYNGLSYCEPSLVDSHYNIRHNRKRAGSRKLVLCPSCNSLSHLGKSFKPVKTDVPLSIKRGA